MTVLSDRLAELKIDFTAQHVALLRNHDGTEKNPWPCDQWHIIIKYNNIVFMTPFYTGLGNRKETGFFRTQYGFKNKYSTIKIYEIIRNNGEHYFRLVKPNIADVLHSLLVDATCANETFENWCSNFGYDTDSRKALETYLVCQATRNSLITMFGNGLFDELSCLEH